MGVETTEGWTYWHNPRQYPHGYDLSSVRVGGRPAAEEAAREAEEARRAEDDAWEAACHAVDEAIAVRRAQDWDALPAAEERRASAFRAYSTANVAYLAAQARAERTLS